MPDLLDRFLQWRKLRRLEKPRGLHALPPLTAPGVYIIFQNETDTGKETNYDPKAVTERELERLNNRIDRLLAKIDDTDIDGAVPETEEECVICMSAKATMQTFPCSHKVVCRKCFIKTIQMAVSQRCLPLRCVVCRSRILKLRQLPLPASKMRPENNKSKRKFFSRVKLHKSSGKK